jgi:multidrug efflux pump subunit AcrB
MDGEILISLKGKHRPTGEHVAALRRELPGRFPGMEFFFQPADIVNQALNFGQPSPIDIRVVGPHEAADYRMALGIARRLRQIPGVVDVHLFQVPGGPAMRIDVDRVQADQFDLTQDDVAKSVLISLSSSAVVSPSFWVNPANQVSYQLVVQTPQYQVNSLADLQGIPLAGGRKVGDQILMNVADISRTQLPMVLSEVDILPVFDVNADVQGRDLASVASDIDRVIAAHPPAEDSGVKISVAGQIQTMRSSFIALAGGILLAIVLVYLLMVISFQSWLDPLIVLLAVPSCLGGVIWMLYLTHTHLSVPALMGTLMCIGLTAANSILVVAFARRRLAAGDGSAAAAVAAGYTRMRPVIMTAGAMALGMIPMALGVGEGGEQNAPLARAVIGGILTATFDTLIFVPAIFGLLHRSAGTAAQPEGIAQ